ncbi:MAG: hypothetical protein L0Y76_02630 [Ignavibacteria bacterium]|nr:hypothetical protein [Ignavibacteria bacterium]
MHKIDIFGKIILLIAVISVFLLILSALAIHDIYKGTEPDLSTEWLIVRISFVLNCIFGFLVIVYFIKKKMKGE